MADISADLQQELDQLQAAYKAAVDNGSRRSARRRRWLPAITMSQSSTNGRRPISTSTSCTGKPTYRKRLYEDALRREFFGF